MIRFTKCEWLSVSLGFILSCLLSFNANASSQKSTIFDCEMTDYHNYWRGKVIDDWSKRQTSPDIKRWKTFAFEVTVDRLKFENGGFFRDHVYDYKLFQISDGYIDIVGVQYTPHLTDTFSFWIGATT